MAAATLAHKSSATTEEISAAPEHLRDSSLLLAAPAYRAVPEPPLRDAANSLAQLDHSWLVRFLERLDSHGRHSLVDLIEPYADEYAPALSSEVCGRSRFSVRSRAGRQRRSRAEGSTRLIGYMLATQEGVAIAQTTAEDRVLNSISLEATTGFEPVIAVLQTTTTALLRDFRGSPRVQISQGSGAVEG